MSCTLKRIIDTLTQYSVQIKHIEAEQYTFSNNFQAVSMSVFDESEFYFCFKYGKISIYIFFKAFQQNYIYEHQLKPKQSNHILI